MENLPSSAHQPQNSTLITKPIREVRASLSKAKLFCVMLMECSSIRTSFQLFRTDGKKTALMEEDRANAMQFYTHTGYQQGTSHAASLLKQAYKRTLLPLH